MNILLVVALGTNAGISILLGTYLAGSRERRNLIWAGFLVAMGAATTASLLAMSVTSSFDRPRAGLGFNPLRIVKRAWETADYVPVIEGFVAGIGLPIAFGFAIWLMCRRLGWHFGPAVTLLMALILSGLFVGAKSVQPTVEAPGPDQQVFVAGGGGEVEPAVALVLEVAQECLGQGLGVV